MMKLFDIGGRRLLATLLLAALTLSGLSAGPAHSDPDKPYPRARIKTSAGDMVMELYPDKAPMTVANFINYVERNHYDGTIFHRVISRFMIQGGGFTPDLERRESGAPIRNESGNGLYNERWTVAMARTDDPDSATDQFFINLRMNPSLDAGRGKLGYTVFGRIVEGQHVVRDISLVQTTTVGDKEDVPVEPVLIESIEMLP